MTNFNFKVPFANSRNSLKNLIDNKRSQSSTQDIRIGLWGTKGSGKTTYLAMLYEALTLSEEWEVFADHAALNFIRNHVKTIKWEKKFPLPSDPTTNELEIFSFTLRPKFSDKNAGDIILSFVDAPGEFYETLQAPAQVISHGYVNSSGRSSGNSSGSFSNDENKTQISIDIIDYLISCDGIIFLLDPNCSHDVGVDEYAALIEGLIWEFQDRCRGINNVDNGKIQQYLAFCVTKVDQDSFEDRIKNPSQLAEEIVGKDLFKKLRNNYCYSDQTDPSKNRFAFFAMSSIGRYKTPEGTWRTPVVDPKKAPEPATSPSGMDYAQPMYGLGGAETFPGSATTAQPRQSLEDLYDVTPSHEDVLSQSMPTLKKGVSYRPFNVIKPINWLVQKIQINPPVRPHMK